MDKKTKQIKVFTTRVRDNDGKVTSESKYIETRIVDKEGKCTFRELERKAWGSNERVKIHGVRVSREDYLELKDEINNKVLSQEKLNYLNNGAFESPDDIGGLFIRWNKLPNGKLRFKKSSMIEEVDPPYENPRDS